MEELEGEQEELRGFQPQGKKNYFSDSDVPGLPGTKPSTKGFTWFQPKMWQRNAERQWEEWSLVR